MGKTLHNILWLRESFPWMGKHSGYDRLFDAFERLDVWKTFSLYRDCSTSLPRGTRKLLRHIAKCVGVCEFYNAHSLLTEIEALRHCLRRKIRLVHITYVENNLGIWSRFSKSTTAKVVGTVHQPAAWWQTRHCTINRISTLSALIVLCTKDLVFFENYLPGRVYFIPHGVDIDFFSPLHVSELPLIEKRPLRCVFCGTWLRDLDTLSKVIDSVLYHDKEIIFDMIIPIEMRNHPALKHIARHSQVIWQMNIADGELRDLYRRANLLLLPLLDCTANNTLLEAIACGLPIVSNNVGGIDDYTEVTFADLFPCGDVEGMVHAILRLANNPEEQKSRSIAARLFAEKKLSWENITSQTQKVYEQVLFNGS